jgi:TATA-box binding protein (TBP) (component of TFIID and TFIIIB)
MDRIVDSYNAERATTIAQYRQFLAPVMSWVGMADLLCDYVMSKLSIVGELQHSTLQALGHMSNVRFHEKDLIREIIPTAIVPGIMCNYGYLKAPEFKIAPERKETKRGRKPKPRTINRRHQQGSGAYFNSQITFCVDYMKPTYYQVKVFRNGKVLIPGGVEQSMSDIHAVLTIVRDMLRLYMTPDIEIVSVYSIMRNFKTSLLIDNVRVNLDALKKQLILDRDNLPPGTEVKYNSERYPGVIVKFNTPIARNAKKRTTLKLFHSGKINIDGTISEESGIYFYNWIRDYYLKHHKLFIYELLVESSDDDSSDDDSSDDEYDAIGMVE